MVMMPKFDDALYC